MLCCKFAQNYTFMGGHGCHEGGAGGCFRPPPLESELSFICIGLSPINDVRAGVGPPLEKFLVTPMWVGGWIMWL